MTGTTAKTLHRTLMGGNPTLQNTGVGGNVMGGSASIAASPPSAMVSGQQQFSGRGSTVWSALTAAVKIFGPATTTQEFLKKI